MASPKRQRTRKTLDAVAIAVGRHRRTVNSWVAKGMPKIKGGGYDIPRIIGWAWSERLLEIAPANKGTAAVGESARNRLDRLRGDEVKLKLAVEQRQVVDLEAARRLIIRRISEAKSLLEQLPDRFAAEMPAEMAPEIRAHVRETTWSALDNVFTLLAELPESSELSARGPADEQE